MNSVAFPGLGINLEINKIAFSIFGANIYWYAICIVTGMILAILLCYFSKEKFGIKFEDILDIAIIIIAVGIIGARIYYVLFKLDYYLAEPSKILAIHDGGLAIYGGILFGGLALIIRAKMLKIDTLDLLDCVVPFVAIAQCLGRWGNFFNVEAYGVETTNFLRMGVNSAQGYIEVHPTFFYESVSTFVIFCILRILQQHRKFKGQVCSMYIILYAFIRFFIESIRSDSLMLGNFKVSMVLSFILFIIGLCFYFIKNRIKKVEK